ncbi:TetR/AcrR family transcriptional regulator [Paragemmobacter ruber]|nr:TetR/AcrR family transcriptional regulator [Rhodobacter ruber]
MRRGGRPLSFDRQAALEKAMLAFWRHGYESTSISDLTAAMGVTAPSLYTAFGDKRRLFLEAMELYVGPMEAVQARLDAAPTARAAAWDLLFGAVQKMTGEATPPGCLMTSATASVSASAVEVQAAVSAVRGEILRRLEARIARDVAEGALPAGTDAAALAALMMGVMQGVSVLARDGMPREALLAMAECAMRAFPGDAGTRAGA